MPFEQSVRVINERMVEALSGPMRLTIQAWKDGQPQIEPARQAAAASFGFLERIAAQHSVLSRPAQTIDREPDDVLAKWMIEDALQIGDEELTPMATVAGTIADAVADWLFEGGLDRVIVENGGDIALRLRPGQRVRVGLRPRVDRSYISHILTLEGSQVSWGVTTSGFGGRSLTRGIASAVICVAGRAGAADAASTAVANACWAEDDAIIRIPARNVDPHTDIPKLMVTMDIGELNPRTWKRAAWKGYRRAEELIRGKIVQGTAIFCGREMLCNDWMDKRIEICPTHSR